MQLCVCVRCLRNCLAKCGAECKKFFGIASVLNLTNSAERLGIGLESKFVCVIRITKNLEHSMLQAASIVGLSPAFLTAFHELTFFGILNLWNSDFLGIKEIVQYGTVRFLKFRFRTIFRNSADPWCVCVRSTCACTLFASC